MTEHLHPENERDEALLQNVRDGCDMCFNALFERHFRHIFAIAYRILRDLTEAEDIMQEVFLDIFLRRETYDPARGSPRAWMLHFAYFKALVRRRYLRIRHFYAAAEALEGHELRATAPAEVWGMNPLEWDLCVEKGINLLEPRQRQAIELVHFNGCTLQEASKIMGLTLANTKNVYYRSMKSLRNYLNAELDSGKLKGTSSLTNAFYLQS